MSDRRKQILSKRGGEIGRAARLFFDALTSPEPGRFFREKGDEVARELEERGAIVVEGELLDDEDQPKAPPRRR